MPKGPGCPRCRLDLLRFTREVKLPRFTLHPGELWHLQQRRYQADGSAELGNGFAPKDSFEVVRSDDTRGCGCTCSKITSM